MFDETDIKEKLRIFGERLKELRGEARLQDVAKDLGISRASLGYYENGDRKPDIEVLMKLAQYYHVSCDYMLGLSNIPSPDIQDQAIQEKTGLSAEAVETLLAGEKASKNVFIDTILTSDHFADMDFFFDQVTFDYEALFIQSHTLMNIKAKLSECTDPERKVELNKEYDKTYERINHLETKCESMLYRVSLRLANLLNEYREKKVLELHKVLGIEMSVPPGKK